MKIKEFIEELQKISDKNPNLEILIAEYDEDKKDDSFIKLNSVGQICEAEDIDGTEMEILKFDVDDDFIENKANAIVLN